jgi:hypothetical protein
MALEPTQLSLKKWTKQDWQYSNPKNEDKPRAERGRYLPKKAWDSLSSSEKAATNAAKRKGSKEGKQYADQPKKLVSKTRKFRQT